MPVANATRNHFLEPLETTRNPSKPLLEPPPLFLQPCGSKKWFRVAFVTRLEVIAQVCIALAMHEGEQDLLKKGIVAWAQQRASTPQTAITLIKDFYGEYSRAQAKCLDLQSWHAMHLLKDLIGRLLLAYSEEALPVVQKIFTEKRIGEISSGRKRVAEDLDDEHSAMVHATAQWGKAHAKKLRTSDMWPSTQPDAMVAMLQGEGVACWSWRQINKLAG